MVRRTVGLCLVGLLAGAVFAPQSIAAEPQIVDPALDHPVPFADILSVSLAVTQVRGRDHLAVTFTVNGEISDASRNVMTGYSFNGKAGSCELLVQWYAYPMVTEPAGLPKGSAGAQCGATGADIVGSFVIKGSTVTVNVPMSAVATKGVVRRATMTNLRAHTALSEGFAGDVEGALAYTGDAASSTKPWVIGP